MASYTLQGFTNDASSADLDATNLNEMDNAIKIGHDFADSASVTPSAGKAMVWPENASGTFEPFLNVGGVEGVETYVLKSGRYIKIGNICYFWIDIVTSLMKTNTGDVTVENLPFTNIGGFSGFNIHYFNGCANITSGLIYANSNGITLFKHSSMAELRLTRGDLVATNLQVIGSGFYMV